MARASDLPTLPTLRGPGSCKKNKDGALSVRMSHAEIVKVGLPAAQSNTSVTRGFKTFLNRYFYFCMALLMAALAAWGFSSTVDGNLLHAKPPKPFLLWFHAAAFSAWIVLFVAQSALGRVREVRGHRTLCWVGWARGRV